MDIISYDYDRYKDPINELKEYLICICKKSPCRILKYGFQRTYIINEYSSVSIANQVHDSYITSYIVVYNYNGMITIITTMEELRSKLLIRYKSARSVIQ